MCKDLDIMCSDGVLYNTVPYVVLGLLYGGRSCVRIKTACVVRGYRTMLLDNIVMCNELLLHTAVMCSE
jgi:hypothetical protein